MAWQNIGNVYASIKPATANELGGVKAGQNVSVGSDGVLSVTSSNVTQALGYTPLKAGEVSIYDFTNSGSGTRNFSSGTIPVSYWGLVGCTNHTAFIPGSCIEVEYTRDGGETWVDYGLTTEQKAELFRMDHKTEIVAGGPSHTFQDEGLGVRVTINPTGIYSQLNFAYTWLSTNGAGSCTMMAEMSRWDDHDSWSVVTQPVPVSGWSGPNTARIEGTFGGDSASGPQYGLRLTYMQSGGNPKLPPMGPPNYSACMVISDIRVFGTSIWRRPDWSYIPLNNVPYLVDSSQNVVFHNKIAEDGGTLLEDKYVLKSEIEAYIEAKLAEKGL